MNETPNKYCAIEPQGWFWTIKGSMTAEGLRSCRSLRRSAVRRRLKDWRLFAARYDRFPRVFLAAIDVVTEARV